MSSYDSVIYTHEDVKYQVIIKSTGLYIKVFKLDGITLCFSRFIPFSVIDQMKYITHDTNGNLTNVLNIYGIKKDYSLKQCSSFSYDHFCEIEKVFERYHSRNDIVDNVEN